MSNENQEWERQWGLEGLKGQIEFAVITIKALLYVNGGALVVLMALVGTIWAGSPDQGAEISMKLKSAFEYFIFGLSLAILTGAFAYFSQTFFTETPVKNAGLYKLGHVFRGLAIITSFSSLGYFGFGAFASLKAFGG
ncbi:MAG: hypothetical protein IH995_07415 [Proteobacteria bacterium]|nr:hypothetical protein [Pseudomonadota bacterium]